MMIDCRALTGFVLLIAVAAFGGESGSARAETPAFERSGKQKPLPAEGLSADDQTRIAFFEALTYAYVFALGTTVGSFLNVVVYRTPQGLGLLWPPSRCPVCETPIRLRDNVPMLSWLVLRGRCRECGTRISPRYFVVEAATAALFLALAHWELLSGGANLPVRPANLRTGVVWILWETQWDLVRMYLFHCALFSMLLAMSLIRLDGYRLPRKLLVVGLLVGLLIPLVWPDLRPVAADGGRPVSVSPSLQGILAASRVDAAWQGFRDGAAGAVAGALLGAALGLGCSKRRPEDPPAGTAAALTIVGMFLGWQAAVAIAALASALLFAMGLASRLSLRVNSASAVACISADAFLVVMTWRHWSEFAGWHDMAVHWHGAVLAAAVPLLLALPTRRLWRAAATIPAWDSSIGSSKD